MDEATREALETAAARKRLSMTAIIRLALIEWLHREGFMREDGPAGGRQEADRGEGQEVTTATKAVHAVWKNAIAHAETVLKHPYLKRKEIESAEGLRVSRETDISKITGEEDVVVEAGLLLVPMRVDGKLVDLQRIWPDGRKRFFPGADPKGGLIALGWTVLAPFSGALHEWRPHLLGLIGAKASGKTKVTEERKPAGGGIAYEPRRQGRRVAKHHMRKRRGRAEWAWYRRGVNRPGGATARDTARVKPCSFWQPGERKAVGTTLAATCWPPVAPAGSRGQPGHPASPSAASPLDPFARFSAV